MKKFMDEFKAFAMRGNVLDMAVGVVIGGAFGKITTSLVNDIIMPVVSVLTNCMIMAINRLHRKAEEPAPEPAPPEPSAEEKLLTEIRDLLKEAHDVQGKT